MMLTMKLCHICHQHKPVGEFYTDRRNKDGYRGGCKPCILANDQKWHLENTERAKEIDRVWREANPEKEGGILLNTTYPTGSMNARGVLHTDRWQRTRYVQRLNAGVKPMPKG